MDPAVFPSNATGGYFSTCGFVNLDMGPSFQSPCDNIYGKQITPFSTL